eukprot:CAMPEP_0172824430 /NCGR_PEP_ID=MMETSP1075-20121228/18006_1 /TAXON_ID=2916 /ORGANISM="Ceratium fusus, Strain PA161109" /LENGTH=130 /DNA_ID=CAMNT_0013665711 /DNA_START=96 /DNA_END=485 /DNA_ORIENTATION=-
MALLTAASLMLTAFAETLSLVWMELAMFVVAGLLYAMFTDKLRFPQFTSRKNGKKTVTLIKGVKCDPGDGSVDTANLTSWESLQLLVDKPPELARMVESMQQAGRTTSQIMGNLRAALKDSPSLLPSLEA